MPDKAAILVNKWSIFIVSLMFGAFGLWGGYKVLGYKVEHTEATLKAHCISSGAETDKVWLRFENDRIERGNNDKAIRETQYNIRSIEQAQKEMTAEQTKQSATLSKILEKVK